MVLQPVDAPKLPPSYPLATPPSYPLDTPLATPLATPCQRRGSYLALTFCSA